MLTAAINTTTSGDQTIIAAVAGQAIRIHSISFSSSASTNVTFKAGATAISGPYQNVLTFSEDWGGTLRIAPGTAFVLNSSAVANIGGIVTYEATIW